MFFYIDRVHCVNHGRRVDPTNPFRRVDNRHSSTTTFLSTSRGDRRCRVASRVRRHHRGRRGSVDCCDRRGLRVPIDVRRRLVRLDVDGDRRRHDDMINTRRIVRARVIRDARDSFDAPCTSRVGRSPLARRLRVSFETTRWLFFAFLAGGDIATAKLSCSSSSSLFSSSLATVFLSSSRLPSSLLVQRWSMACALSRSRCSRSSRPTLSSRRRSSCRAHGFFDVVA